MRSGIWGGVVGDAGGNEARTSYQLNVFVKALWVIINCKLTRGGLRYSIPMLLARRDVFSMSFIRL